MATSAIVEASVSFAIPPRNSSLPQMPEATPTPATFIAAHTIINNTVQVFDECPICLDNYSTEQCLRITKIEGCTHRIGQTCLEHMLQNRPNEEKKCPLCRTTWIPSALVRSSTLLQGRRAQDARLINGHAGMRERALERQTEMAAMIARNNRTGRNAPDSIPIIDPDSESEDYAAEVDRFNALARDIADVRTRARNTQVSRSQRRKLTREASVNTGQRDGSSGDGEGTETAMRPIARFNRKITNTFRLPSQGPGIPSAPVTEEPPVPTVEYRPTVDGNSGHRPLFPRVDKNSSPRPLFPHIASHPPRLEVNIPSNALSPGSSSSDTAAEVVHTVPPAPELSGATLNRGQQSHGPNNDINNRDNNLRSHQFHRVIDIDEKMRQPPSQTNNNINDEEEKNGPSNRHPYLLIDLDGDILGLNDGHTTPSNNDQANLDPIHNPLHRELNLYLRKTRLSHRETESKTREADLRIRENLLNSRREVLDERENDFSSREIQIADRKTLVEQRARELDERERVLVARERAVAASEERVKRLVRLVQEQQDDRERVGRKQREEVKRMIGGGE